MVAPSFIQETVPDVVDCVLAEGSLVEHVLQHLPPSSKPSSSLIFEGHSFPTVVTLPTMGKVLVRPDTIQSNHMGLDAGAG